MDNKKIEPLLWLRFVGPELNIKALPIYELGTVLISIQRIINKSYLYKKDALVKGAQLSPHERKQYALQIGAHQKSSDEYGFIPFFTDPVVVDHIKTLVVDGIVALGAYAAGKAVAKKDSPPPANQYFIGSIYNEVSTINDRITNIGGVEKIEIRGGAKNETPIVQFDQESQNYIRNLEREMFLGDTQEIEGTITKLYPNRLIAEIKIAPNYYTKVFLRDAEFDTIRYQTRTGDIVKFLGRPRYRLGHVTSKIREFEAIQILTVLNDH
jgi:hypothetical protein